MVIIIGAGLSGLLTAYRLKKAKIPFKVLEERNRIGGRVYTCYGHNNTPVEMGATWFGQQHHLLLSLLKELGLAYFEQYMKGTSYYQASSNNAAQAIELPNQEPSYRIVGGTGQLIKRLFKELDEKDVILNQAVRKLTLQNNNLLVETDKTYKAKHVIITVPPKIWAHHISFEPKLPINTMAIAKETHTWMEDSIKVAFVYNQAFWKTKKLSGALFSNSGPLIEFYDHSNKEETAFALCGFLHPAYKKLTEDERKLRVLNQLKEVFGNEALNFTDYFELIWSLENQTFFPSNPPLFPHQNNGNSLFQETYLKGRLLFSGTESSPHFGGYMEGAVYASNTVIQKITFDS
ncbi:flavin monoamine oxidase family protein [Eudoraea sp.]|uniref:flavin monoamine oxidase family protein n=1 Tax=Eudoraea sp. TaxID=1979955 RepID=UPI003C74DBF3